MQNAHRQRLIALAESLRTAACAAQTLASDCRDADGRRCADPAVVAKRLETALAKLDAHRARYGPA